MALFLMVGSDSLVRSMAMLPADLRPAVPAHAGIMSPLLQLGRYHLTFALRLRAHAWALLGTAGRVLNPRPLQPR